MQKEKKALNWVEIMENFSTYKGKIFDFCKENNIKPQQLYPQRKKLNQLLTRTFQAIAMSKSIYNSNNDNEEIKMLEDTLTCSKYSLIDVNISNYKYV